MPKKQIIPPIDTLEKEDALLLLGLSIEIASARNRKDLGVVVNDRLKMLFSIREFGIAQIDEDPSTYSAFLLDLEEHIKNQPGFDEITSGRYKVNDPVFHRIMQSEGPVLFKVDDLSKEPDMPAFVGFWKAAGLREIVSVALRVGGRPIGCVFLHIDTQAITGFRYQLLTGVCAQLSVAISNILSYEEITRRENERALLLSLSVDISAVRNNDELLRLINQKLKSLLGFSHTLIATLNEDKTTVRAFLMDPDSTSKTHPFYQEAKKKNYPIRDGVMDKASITPAPHLVDLGQLKDEQGLPLYLTINHDSGIQQAAVVRFSGVNGVFGFWMLFFVKKTGIGGNIANLIEGLAHQLSISVSNIIANEKVNDQLQEINRYRQQLELEKNYLKEEIENTQNHSEMIGESPEMQTIFRLVAQVAPSGSTVLLLGETGTGKELIARAIHNGSPRKNKLMVKVNCAALPPNLIESELFGHERGSFTGATERRLGKFELADHGTLFLDEIGEMPMELQVKLLRAIQEREIERVGGTATIKVDVRIIAATSRDLEKSMEEGKFRTDLYYRLNIFPIGLPPLRDRQTDIPLLAQYFLLRSCKNTGKKIHSFSSKAMQELMQYSWPGNIRELEHLIERTVILSKEDMIHEVHLPSNKTLSIPSTGAAPVDMRTIDENERNHILQVLKYCNGKITGKTGAAEILGVPPSTLNSKIKRLAIKKEYYQ